MPGKDLSEIAAGTKTTTLADLSDTGLSVGKQLTGDLQAIICEIFDGRCVKMIVKYPEAFPFAEVSGGRKVLDADFLRIVFVDVNKHQLDAIVAVVDGCGILCGGGGFCKIWIHNADRRLRNCIS